MSSLPAATRTQRSRSGFDIGQFRLIDPELWTARQDSVEAAMSKLSEGAHGNVIQLEYYQHEAARRRRRAWWRALILRVRPENKAQAKSMPVSCGGVVKFRKQAGPARW
jgi:hypothetical protein